MEYAPGEGETWGFACVKRYSYFFAAFSLGNWDSETCAGLVKLLSKRLRTPSEEERLVVYSDGKDYAGALELFFNTAHVDYAQLVKIRKSGRVVDKIRNVVYGIPNINCVHTNNIENFNGILRGRIAYLVRKTKCIAKKRSTLELSLHWFQFYWNYIHVLKDEQTPAMLEGISNKIWGWNDFLQYKVKLR